jgi:multisubunit Na+/H+ antiporter MnhC subunit
MGYFLVFFAVGFYCSSDIFLYFDLKKHGAPLPQSFVVTRDIVAGFALLGVILLIFSM